MMRQCLLLLLLFSIPRPSAAVLRNVLFIAVDDLRPNLGAYGIDFMKTPHIDALARSGTTFDRAYVQFSFCAPSRNSFMSGRRPDATQSFSFKDHFREAGVGDQWSSMPQYFRERGFTTRGVGKLFHPGLPPNADAAKSWDEFVWPWGGKVINCTDNVNGWPVDDGKAGASFRCVQGSGGLAPPPLGRFDKHGGCSNSTGAIIDIGLLPSGVALWCSLNTTKLTSPLVDDITTAQAVKWLQELGKDTNKSSSPWFLAVGYHKPHTPWNFPSKYAARYAMSTNPAASIPPRRRLPPDGMPMAAWHESWFNNSWGAPTPVDRAIEFRRAYYSCISYVDDQVGAVLTALDKSGMRNDTAVLLVGDHGWQLGEMNLWHKMTNFELGTRIPFILRAPWISESIGARRSALVEAVDIYPTLVSLAGLGAINRSQESVQGVDLTPLLHDDHAPSRSKYAFSQFPKGYHSLTHSLTHSPTHSHSPNHPKGYIRSHEPSLHGAKEAWNECGGCTRSEIDVHGYAVRSDGWRYVEWRLWNKTSLSPEWGVHGLVGRELYNHTYGAECKRGDFDCATPDANMWNQSDAMIEVADRLAKVVRAQFQGDHLPPQQETTPWGM